MKMKIVSRDYNLEVDFEKIMQFLRSVYQETGSLQNWFPDRFENSCEDHVSDIRIWEEINDTTSPPHHKIVAIANPEELFCYFIQIHPDYGFLEKEIIQWIESHSVAKKTSSGQEQKLSIVTVDGNSVREKSLTQLGFKKRTDRIYGHLRFRPLDLPIEDYSLPEGFIIRSVNGRSDHEQLARGVRTVFGHGEWFDADLSERIRKRTFHVPDLDLVAVAPDGIIAAFCTLRVDPESRITQLEPMGTLPEFRKRGLAKALLAEGFKRLEKYNPKLIYIGGAAYNPGAMGLYEPTFPEKIDMHIWTKEI